MEARSADAERVEMRSMAVRHKADGLQDSDLSQFIEARGADRLAWRLGDVNSLPTAKNHERICLKVLAIIIRIHVIAAIWMVEALTLMQ